MKAKRVTPCRPLPLQSQRSDATRFGLQDIVVDATHREFHFYNSARLDGLAKRIELFGVKVRVLEPAPVPVAA